MSVRVIRTQFDPRRIAGLLQWFDASKPSSVTLNGSNVSQWSDLSGAARHATQTTAANQPAYQSTGWGGSYPTIAFTGSSSHFLTFTPFSTSAITIFAAVEPTAAIASGTGADILACNPAVSGTPANSRHRLNFTNFSGYRTVNAYLGANGVAGAVGADVFEQARMHLSVAYDGVSTTSTSSYVIRKNRAGVTSQTSGNFNMEDNTASIGRRSAAGGQYFTGRISSIIIYSRALTLAETQYVEDGLASLYPL